MKYSSNIYTSSIRNTEIETSIQNIPTQIIPKHSAFSQYFKQDKEEQMIINKYSNSKQKVELPNCIEKVSLRICQQSLNKIKKVENSGQEIVSHFLFTPQNIVKSILQTSPQLYKSGRILKQKLQTNKFTISQSTIRKSEISTKYLENNHKYPLVNKLILMEGLHMDEKEKVNISTIIKSKHFATLNSQTS